MASKAALVYSHQCMKNIKRTVKTLFNEKNLLYTNTTISLLMSCAGDGLQQKYQISKKEINGWDRRRSRDVGITGLVIGPFCHYWYLFLDWWLPGKTARIVTKKLLVDQLICSPVAILSFLSLTSYLEGKRGQEFKNELVTKGKTLYTAEWFIWPPAQIINFCFLPTRYRVLFDNSVSFGFDWYFSYVKYGKCSNDIDSGEIENNILVTDTNTTGLHISEYGSHLPFLHIQAASMVESRIGDFHWDNWNEWFYVKDCSKPNVEKQTDSKLDSESEASTSNHDNSDTAFCDEKGIVHKHKALNCDEDLERTMNISHDIDTNESDEANYDRSVNNEKHS